MFQRTFVLGLSAGLLLVAAEQEPVKKIKGEKYNKEEAAQIFRSSCASCHGENGKGGGPAATALKTPPPDLTQLAKRNGGKYPSAKVLTQLTTVDVTSHGSREMPVWGNLFRTSDAERKAILHKAYNVMKYVETLQEK